MTPYKHNLKQQIRTDAESISADRGFIAHLQVPGAAATAQDLVSVLAATALTDTAQAITADIESPLVARSLRIKGNAAGITGDVTITGTNIAYGVITETVALSGADAVETVKAFKTITKIDLPIQTHAGTDTVSVGVGNKLGSPYKLTRNTVLMAFRNDVREATAPTITTGNVDIEYNTALLNSALNGTAVDIYLIV